MKGSETAKRTLSDVRKTTMPKFDTKSIRNLALLGHSGSGKTSLAEAMMYVSGTIDRLGKVSDGNTVCDYDPEEIKRSLTLSSKLTNIEWKGITIHIIDTLYIKPAING